MSDRPPLILIVEDDPGVQGLIATLMEGLGYEVVTARDGLEGLVKVELRHPTLVILDMMMPNVDGERVLSEMRQDTRLAEVPVVVVSGRPDVRRALGPIVGRENVFAKPFDPDALTERVRAIVEDHLRRSPIAPDRPVPPSRNGDAT